jgi:hypothetical protein
MLPNDIKINDNLFLEEVNSTEYQNNMIEWFDKIKQWRVEIENYRIKLEEFENYKNKQQNSKLAYKLKGYRWRDQVWIANTLKNSSYTLCYSCNIKLSYFSNWEAGHINARSKTKDNHVTNLVILCHSCNSKCKNNNLHDFIIQNYKILIRYNNVEVNNIYETNLLNNYIECLKSNEISNLNWKKIYKSKRITFLNKWKENFNSIIGICDNCYGLINILYRNSCLNPINNKFICLECCNLDCKLQIKRNDITELTDLIQSHKSTEFNSVEFNIELTNKKRITSYLLIKPYITYQPWRKSIL